MKIIDFPNPNTKDTFDKAISFLESLDNEGYEKEDIYEVIIRMWLESGGEDLHIYGDARPDMVLNSLRSAIYAFNNKLHNMSYTIENGNVVHHDEVTPNLPIIETSKIESVEVYADFIVLNSNDNSESIHLTVHGPEC